MFIFVGFCDVLSAGVGSYEKSANGFDVLSASGSMSDLIPAEVRFIVMAIKLLVFLMLAAPVWLIFAAASKGQALNAKLPFNLCVASCVLGILWIIAKKILMSMSPVPDDIVSIGFGIYLYILTGVVGAVIAKKQLKSLES